MRKIIFAFLVALVIAAGIWNAFFVPSLIFSSFVTIYLLMDYSCAKTRSYLINVLNDIEPEKSLKKYLREESNPNYDIRIFDRKTLIELDEKLGKTFSSADLSDEEVEIFVELNKAIGEKLKETN